jgi:hypothetical protein
VKQAPAGAENHLPTNSRIEVKTAADEPTVSSVAFLGSLEALCWIANKTCVVVGSCPRTNEGA